MKNHNLSQDKQTSSPIFESKTAAIQSQGANHLAVVFGRSLVEDHDSVTTLWKKMTTLHVLHLMFQIWPSVKQVMLVTEKNSSKYREDAFQEFSNEEIDNSEICGESFESI
jgi:hypothetical protein